MPQDELSQFDAKEEIECLHLAVHSLDCCLHLRVSGRRDSKVPQLLNGCVVAYDASQGISTDSPACWTRVHTPGVSRLLCSLMDHSIASHFDENLMSFTSSLDVSKQSFSREHCLMVSETLRLRA